jgi:hypothetical protein
MLRLENRRLKWFIKQEDENEEDLNLFRSLVPYAK